MAVIKQLLSLGLLALLVGTTISDDPSGGSSNDTTTLPPDGSTNTTITLTPETVTTISATTTVTGGSTNDTTTLLPDGSTNTTITLTPETVTTISATTTVTDGSTNTTITLTPVGSTTTTTTLAPGPCVSDSCPFGSTCQELLSNYTCLCRPGLFYDETQKSCYLARTFPNSFTIDKDFNKDMGDRNSEIFKNISNEIVNTLENVFKDNNGYLGSTVLKLEKGSIIADVQNFFSVKSDVSSTYVEDKLKEAINIPSGILQGAKIEVKNVCAIDYCDAQSTKCNHASGLATCSCKEGYIQLTATQQACIPCPSGEQAVGSKTCKPCGFGYSGFNCQESYLLILVVVACVLGALLLGTLIGLAVMSSRSKKTSKNSEKNTPGGTLEFNKPVGITRIPRANPNSAAQPNSLEMTDSGSRYALVSSMWESDYNDDAKSSKNQAPSRTGYEARPARNPYVDVYENRNQRF